LSFADQHPGKRVGETIELEGLHLKASSPGRWLIVPALPSGRDIPTAMKQTQHFDASFHWAVEHHVAANREMANVAAQIRALFAHSWLRRMELEFLLDGVEKAKRDRTVLTFPSDVPTNLF
jgi:hypothetical protein